MSALPSRTRSQSSAGTIRAAKRRSSAASQRSAHPPDSDSEDDDGNDTFFDFGLGDEVQTPTMEYPQRLEELLGNGGLEAAGRPTDDDDDDSQPNEFLYDGQDGPDQERLAARRAEWGLDGDDLVSEKEMIKRYGTEMKDILGEEEAREEDEDAGELEIESIVLDTNTPQNDGQSSERSSPSFSSAQRRFTEHLSPPVTSSPSGSVASKRPLHPSRPVFLHPTVSRLRSHNRHVSTSTVNTLSSLPPGAPYSGASSHFSQLSRSESSSTINSILHPNRLSDDSTRPFLNHEQPAPPPPPTDEDVFRWSTLQRISLALYPQPTTAKSSSKLQTLAVGQLPPGLRREQLGHPTKMVAGGLVCVGMSSGFVGVWDFRGEAKGWFGNEALLSDAGPVTALEISSDHTYIAVGHEEGHVYLYQLSSSPSTPARSVAPIPLSAINKGHKEGHLKGSRILHAGFVGKRHTAVVTGDDKGMAFYHSLGRVLGVDSTDVLRILGSYPDPAPPPLSTLDSSDGTPRRPKRKTPTTLFAASPLPLVADSPHPADDHHFTALLTPAKLVIVGLKPSPRTWFRRMRAGEGGEGSERVGTACWKPSSAGGDPALAFSWGRSVRFVKALKGAGGTKGSGEVDFVEDGRWEAQGIVLGMQWQSQTHLLLVTSEGLEAVDTSSLTRSEHSAFDSSLLVASLPYSGAPSSSELSLSAGFSVYKGKAFVLTKKDIRVATVVSWTDRILTLMESGDILGAIRLTTDFYLGRFSNSLLGLPSSDEERHELVGLRLRELLRASVRYTFSEDRMTDGTHESNDGRGVDRTTLFEGLVTDAANACLALDDLNFLFEDVFDQYQSNWIDAIYCRQLVPFVVDGRLRSIPTQVAQRLLQVHDEAQDLVTLETLVWNLDPGCLDINQAIQLCRKHRLWDALIFVYNRSLLDYVSPVVHLISLVRTIQEQRNSRPARVDPRLSPSLDQEAEDLVPDAYKVFAYISHVLAGSTYPTGEPIPEAQRQAAQASIYNFVFSGRSTASPITGELVLTSLTPDGAEPLYPYLFLLLLFDTESFLHSLDIAFEDGFLNGQDDSTLSTISRQSIVEILLEVMAADDFSSSDCTLLHIFVARNLPKYPQFLSLPQSTLHTILSALTDDPDQSTREDRELAVEYLLSAYTPQDRLGLLPRFQQAGFYRILRSIYRSERRWPSLITAYLDDPEADFDVFPSVEEVLRAATAGNAPLADDLQEAVVDVVPRLADISVRQVAALVDRYNPSRHERALERLSSNPRQQYGYLRTLIESTLIDQTEETGLSSVPITTPSQQLPTGARTMYIGLLCEQDPGGVVPLLRETPNDYFDLSEVARVCEDSNVPEAVVWSFDRLGQTKAAFERVGRLIDDSGSSIANRFLEKSDSHPTHELQDLRDVTRVAVEICLERASARAAPADISLEDMWFDLLHPLLDLAHSASSFMPASPIVPSTPTLRSLSIDGPFTLPSERQQPTLIFSLHALVQESLSSLVSSSSGTSLAFPPLFKRLLDASSTNDGKARGSYGEFRRILSGMLDTYKQEGEMISVTVRLLEQDVFDALALQAVAVRQGWRVTLPDVKEDLDTPLALPSSSDSDSTTSPPKITFKAYRSGVVDRLEQDSHPVASASA